MDPSRKFQITLKDGLLLAFTACSSFAAMRADDPWVVVPMLSLSAFALIIICKFHTGPVKYRWLVAIVVVGLFAFLGWRALRPPEHSQLGGTSLTTTAMYVGIGNMPERSRVRITWDGKPWDENAYSDVRLKITNNTDYLLQNLDLSVGFPDDLPKFLIAGIGQISDINGVEFHGFDSPQFTLGIRGQDGKVYKMPFPPESEKMTEPSRTFKVFTPRLEAHETLNLIIAVGYATGPRRVPGYMQVTGTGETTAGEGSRRALIDRRVYVNQ